MKLYDEIMALKIHDHTSFTNYQLGFNDSLEQAAELAKKYDADIEMLLELSRTRYDEGLLAGQENMRRTLDEVAALKESHFNDKEKLKTLLLNAEDEISRLKETSKRFRGHD